MSINYNKEMSYISNLQFQIEPRNIFEALNSIERVRY